MQKKKKPAIKTRFIKGRRIYVAFLDILGFSRLLKSKNFREQIEGIVRSLHKRAEFDGKHYPSLKYLAISDTIIITAGDGDGYVLVRKVSQIQNALLKAGFAVRGGVAFGHTLTHTGDLGRNLFGKTYLNAYNAEKELAIYPRVVIVKDTVARLKKDISAETNRELKTYVLRDVDGVSYINQFSSDVIGLNSDTAANRSRALGNRAIFLEKIDAGLDTVDPKAAMKWQWLKRQLDRHLPDPQ